jgi:hypothetical protein
LIVRDRRRPSVIDGCRARSRAGRSAPWHNPNTPRPTSSSTKSSTTSTNSAGTVLRLAGQFGSGTTPSMANLPSPSRLATQSCCARGSADTFRFDARPRVLTLGSRDPEIRRSTHLVAKTSDGTRVIGAPYVHPSPHSLLLRPMKLRSRTRCCPSFLARAAVHNRETRHSFVLSRGPIDNPRFGVHPWAPQCTNQWPEHY